MDPPPRAFIILHGWEEFTASVPDLTTWASPGDGWDRAVRGPHVARRELRAAYTFFSYSRVALFFAAYNFLQ